MTTPPIDWDALFPGCYNADDFEGGIERTVRIETIRREELTVIGPGGKPTGAKEWKPSVVFSDAAKILVLNKTNAALIGAMLGKRTSAWIGKRITLHAEPNCGFGRPGVRVCGSPDIAADVKAKIGLMPNPGRVYALRKTTAEAPAANGRRGLAAVLDDLGLTPAEVDRWLEQQGKPPLSSGVHDAELAGWLDANHARADLIRAANEEG